MEVEITNNSKTLSIYYRDFKGYFSKPILNPNPSQVALTVKNLPANVGDTRDAGSIPGL